jgi:HTH-type transcriptional regulator/antitoxin HigA
MGDPIDAIEAMMKERGWTRRDLIPAFGHSGHASEVMSRKRPLSLGMIRCLVINYKMDAETMIQWYPTEQVPDPERYVEGTIVTRQKKKRK